MKYLLLAILFSTMLAQDYFGKDKVVHFGVGYVAAYTAHNTMLKYTKNEKLLKFGPLAVCIGLGVAKELIDHHDSNPKSKFDMFDIAYTLGAGITFISIDINKR